MTPTGFVSHGAPTLALDAAKGAPLRAWGEALGRPSAVLCVSAHWETDRPTLGATETLPLIYDFGGFDRALYEVSYPAPGAPELAERVAELVDVDRAPRRGWDHGVWTPLVWMWPGADVPVLQLSLPRASPAELVALGAALRPLRADGVFILGSGSMTHNLGRMSRDGFPPAQWAEAFDAWIAEVLGDRRDAELLDYERTAPRFRTAHPTDEHWTPLLVALGAADPDAPATFPVTGWEYGNLSRRCVQLGQY